MEVPRFILNFKFFSEDWLKSQCRFHHRVKIWRFPGWSSFVYWIICFSVLILYPLNCFYSRHSSALLIVNSFSGLSLIVICSSENENRAHMAAALDQYRLGTIPHCCSSREIRQYLKLQLKPRSQQRATFRDQVLPWIPAAALDREE